MRLATLVAILFAVALVTGARAQSTSTVAGTAIDAETGEPVGFVQVLLEEANRSATADRNGYFEIRLVQPDAYTLKAYRIGYEPLIRSVQLAAADTLRITLRMSVTPIEQGEVIVQGVSSPVDQLADAAMQVEGKKLRQNLGTTIAETLADEPGVSMRSMGPAPARPVLRGLGGERLLVLEDGGRTGDLSATSTDHAVVVDPLTAKRIEVIRGPAALIYGPNTLGGVINVVRGYIPSSMPRQVNVGTSIQGESANSGFSGGFGIEAPVGPVALHADGSLREAGDVSTPIGPLENTALTTYSGSFGGSVVEDWGHAGISGSYYESTYGIPGGFVGAHPNGVNIDVQRERVEVRAEIFDPLPFVPRVEIDGSASRYAHQEWESDDVLGIEFGLLSYHGSMLFHTHQNGHFRKGAVGFWGEYRDYASGGFSFTPNSTEWTVAGFGYEDLHFEGFTLQGGLRYDVRTVRPRVADRESPAGIVRTRSFGGVSASVRGLIHPSESVTAGASLMRSLRVPGIEELFSEGPHLASYSFEIGNADLGVERGLGAEVFGQFESAHLSGSLTLFRNDIDDFIYPRNTGEMNTRTLLPIYQQTGAKARMIGAEASATVRPSPSVSVSGSAEYVHGTLTDRDEPLPWMPPLRGKIDASYSWNRLTVGATVRSASEQDRVSEFEEPTDGYVVFGSYAQYHLTTGRFLHTIDLGVENVTDTEYRDHLSRVKSVMPEQGRNVKLLYKLFL
ncbi:MAG: TonB-dependent receptor [Rhodothermales bacterium]